MRVNPRVFTERTDMLDGIRIPNCPSQFKTIAENIMNMMTKPGYSFGSYNTMTEADKILMVNYWEEYDNLEEVIGRDGLSFYNWFLYKATPPELIRRARQFLVERHYLIPNAPVAERAYQAGEKFGRAIKQ
jgi:hypothetical protein